MEITVKPFKSEVLEEKLASAFPDYLIKRMGKRIGVRKKKFTLTQHLSLALEPEKGIVKSQTSLYLGIVFIALGIALGIAINWMMIFSFGIVGVYVMLKSSSIKALEKEVMDKVQQILTQPENT